MILAASLPDSFFKFLPEILKSAASGPLGILALTITAAAIVLVFLGRGLPAIPRSGILILVLIGVGALVYRVFSAAEKLPSERGVIAASSVSPDKEPPEANKPTKPEPPNPAESKGILKGLTKHHLLGTDVSQFDTINWSKVGETPISFVFVRASQGTSRRDSAFALHWKAAGQAGLLRGAYHFFVADQDPATQARNFLEVLGGVGVTSAELPAALDLEEVPGRNPVDNFTFIKGIQVWLDIVERATKRKPIIYTSKSFWDAHGSEDFGEYTWSLPRYISVLPGPKDLPRGWKRWTLWQYGAAQQFGSFGEVDGNVLDLSSAFVPAK